MRIRCVAAVFAAVMMAGCSNRQVYDAAQSSQRIQCSKLPEWQYDECMDRTGKSYDEYLREREAAGKI